MDIVSLLGILHEADRTLASARRTLESVRSRPVDAQRAVEQASGRREATEAEIRSVEQARRDASRRLETYERRRDQAQRALDAGMGDVGAAERQIAQCSEILDGIETEILEHLEALDQLEERLVSEREAEEQTEAALAIERQRQTAEEPPAREQLTIAKKARAAAWGTVPRDVQSRYEALIQRKGTAVTALFEGACRSCRMIPGVELRRDHDRGLLVSCRGCGRWLIPDAS